MNSYFTASTNVTVLFKAWSTSSWWEYTFAIIGTCIFGIMASSLKTLRANLHLMMKPRNATLLNTVVTPVIFISDYLLMLIAMTFDVGLFLSTVGGQAAAFLFLGHLSHPHHVDEESEQPSEVEEASQRSASIKETLLEEPYIQFSAAVDPPCCGL